MEDDLTADKFKYMDMGKRGYDSKRAKERRERPPVEIFGVFYVYRYKDAGNKHCSNGNAEYGLFFHPVQDG